MKLHPLAQGLLLSLPLTRSAVVSTQDTFSIIGWRLDRGVNGRY